jgi:hypothetical protein
MMTKNNIPVVKANNCLHGVGIVCGLTVSVTEDCSILLTEGSVITTSGVLIPVSDHLFKSYKKVTSDKINLYFKNLKINQVWELSEVHDSSTDPLKKQSPKDTPTRDFLEKKIMVLLQDLASEQLYFILIDDTDAIRLKGIEDTIKKIKTKSQPKKHTGVFAKEEKSVFNFEYTEKAIFSYLQLSHIVVPRFGYKTLAIKDASQPFGYDNFENPFLRVNNFKSIFFEYKAILDNLVPQFYDALTILHKLYGKVLTHKGENYWEKYRNILGAKWDCFLAEGEHLYYIQYFYDWLCDLVKAYNELCHELTNYMAVCTCDANSDQQKLYTISFLGPILGSQSSYKSLIFRDTYIPTIAMNNNEENLRRIKFLHWRMMMMIWTFDLPGLKLDEKVLRDKFKVVPAKEYEDSTNFFEKNLNAEHPIRFTPSGIIQSCLGQQAIPFYYPLDSDSPYSIHQYWNFQFVKENRNDQIYSYNVIMPDKDSYSQHIHVQYPWAFTLREFPFTRIEGAIGKIYETSKETVKQIIELVKKTNCCIDFAFIKVDANWFRENIKFLNGLEHQSGALQGQTIVYLYVGLDEQIELNECKKDNAPEIVSGTIIADFTLPYRLSLENLSSSPIEIVQIL